MSKLIGTNPNQVPSNADLGTAAFMDKKEFLLSKGSEMSAINAVITKTAVDVFVYDTSKDSDGGAWRKRTQHLSWHNEKLNTTTRGKRKEFPAVAVIVTENNKVTIYDGDDPDMPMWMVFEGTSLSWVAPMLVLFSSSRPATSVAALNGIVCLGTVSGNDSESGLFAISFLTDSATRYSSFHPHRRLQSIANRHVVLNHHAADYQYSIVNGSVRDIAMTVLPNAPIDADTGLPVPTIAVATDGGVSVIKDDGTVVDITVNNASYTHAHKVDFLNDNSLGMSIGVTDGIAQESYYIFNNIPVSDNVITVDNIAGTTQNVDEFYAIQHPNTLVDLQIKGLDTNRKLSASTGNIFGSNEGLSIIDRKVGAPDKGMVAYITSDYNTGWMNGNIKLATLSDTDTTNVTGTELVTNGTFASDTGWTKGAGWTISGGGAVASNVTSGVKIVSSSFTVTAGYYVISVDVNTSASTYYFGVQGATGAATGVTAVQGQVSITKYLNSGSHTAYIGAWSSGLSGTFDNLSVRLAEPDRSVNGNGVQVFGTVTKTAVATGADLVAYNASTSSSYLEQPYNSDLDFGTAGDFHYSFWVYSDSTATYNGATYIFERTSVGDPSSRRIEARLSTSTNLQVYATSLAFVTGSTAITVASDSWSKVDIIRKNNIGSVWVNGVQKVSGSHSGNMTDTAATLTVCNRGYFSPHNQGFPTGISLFRVSATAPTAEQIKKMYNDEKFLFQENAKATLYGTSDAVTALAYDDDTELLHVGTSAGRSDFQGLRRINNTTRAIGTAISAVDGFVVEE